MINGAEGLHKVSRVAVTEFQQANGLTCCVLLPREIDTTTRLGTVATMARPALDQWQAPPHRPGLLAGVPAVALATSLVIAAQGGTVPATPTDPAGPATSRPGPATSKPQVETA